jgi:hypothetical protein
LPTKKSKKDESAANSPQLPCVKQDLRDLPGRKNAGNPFVVGKLSIPLVLYPISMFTFFRGTIKKKTNDSFHDTHDNLGTALAFGGLATSHMGGPLSGLLCQGAAGLGAALLVISQILYVRPSLFPSPPYLLARMVHPADKFAIHVDSREQIDSSRKPSATIPEVFRSVYGWD